MPISRGNDDCGVEASAFDGVDADARSDSVASACSRPVQLPCSFQKLRLSACWVLVPAGPVLSINLSGSRHVEVESSASRVSIHPEP